MYNQSVQPQVPYQVPYLHPVGNPSQGDSLDQASRLIDLVEKIAARQNNGGNIAPGTSQYSPVNAGQFQSRSQEELAAQELAMRSLSNNQQGQSGEKTISRENIETAGRAVSNMASAFEYQRQLLSQTGAVADSLLKLVNSLQSELIEKDAAISLGLIAKKLSDAFSQELEAAHDLIAVQDNMLRSPLYLLEHSFGLFDATISAGDTDAVDLISSYYLQLVKNFEDRNLANHGKYSPQYSQYLEGQINTTQGYQSAIAGADQDQITDGVINFAEGLRSPGFAQNLKRAHVSRNLLR